MGAIFIPAPTRRALLQGIPGGLVAALAAGSAAKAADIVPNEARIVPGADFERDLMNHARYITKVLRDSAPEGSWVKGFQFFCADGEMREDTIWGTVMLPDYNLAHTRPAVFDGWRSQGKTL